MATYGEDVKILTTKALFTETIKSKTGTTGISISDSGEISIGASTGGITHTVYGYLAIDNNGSGGTAGISFASNNAAVSSYIGSAASTNDMITGSAADDFCIRNKQKILFSADGGTKHGEIASSGAWTLGASGTTPIHNINGSIQHHGSNNFSEKWGTTTSLGDDVAVAVGDSNTNGIIMVQDISEANFFIVYLRGGNNATLTHLDMNGVVAITDTDGKWCVYYSGSNYYLKNRRGTFRAVTYKFQGTIG